MLRPFRPEVALGWCFPTATEEETKAMEVSDGLSPKMQGLSASTDKQWQSIKVAAYKASAADFPVRSQHLQGPTAPSQARETITLFNSYLQHGDPLGIS